MNKRSATQWLQIDAMGVAACLAITAGAYFLGVHPLIEARESHAALMIEVQQHKEKAAGATSSVADLRRQIDSLETAARSEFIALQPAHQSNRRMGELSQLASAHGLRINVLNTANSRTQSRFEVVPIVVAGTGSFGAFTSFVHALRQQFPDIGVTRLRVSNNVANDNAHSSFEANLSWYAAPAVGSAEK